MDPLSRATIQIPKKTNEHVLRLAMICIGLLLPFSINHFIQGRFVLGLLPLPVVVLFALNAHCIIRRGHYYTRATNMFLVPLSLVFSAACTLELGINGVLWSFPIVLSFYLLLPERNAQAANVALVLLVSALAYLTLDLATAVRVLATLTLVSIATAFLINVIASQHRAMRLQAIKDPISGAFNTSMLEPALSHAIQQSNRRDIDMSIIKLTIENLELINRDHGYRIGDETLKTIVQSIDQNIECVDRIFRTSGKEFLLLLSGACTDKAEIVSTDVTDAIFNIARAENLEIEPSTIISTLQTSDSWREWLARATLSNGSVITPKHEKAATHEAAASTILQRVDKTRVT